MIRAIRPAAMAQDDATMIAGWNISPNVAYTLYLTPGSSACGVFLFDADMVSLLASGAALVGTAQPCILVQNAGAVGMVDADLGWHLLLTTTGTESQRTIRIGPAVDLPDEIHPVYGEDALALVRATAAIDAAAHYVDDITVTCPLGLGAGLGDVVSVPVDGVSVIGQVESVTWTATPDATPETVVIRRHVAIAPEPFIEPTPPALVADTASTDAVTEASGNVLDNDDTGLTVVAVNGLSSNVGSAVAGSAGGLFTISADGAWSFDPASDFDSISEDAETSITYHASDGGLEASTTLTVTVSPVSSPLWTPSAITTALWLDAADAETITDVDGKASQFEDKSSRGLVLSESTAGARPVIGANKLTFSGGQKMDCPTSIQPDADGGLYVFAVANRQGAQACLIAERISGRGAIFQMANYSGVYYIYSDMLNSPSNATISLADFNATAGLHQAQWVHKPGLRTGFSVNGMTRSVLTGTASTLNGGAGCRLGMREGAIGAGWVGDFHEAICLTSEPSAALAQIIQGYFAHKWDALLGVTTLVDALSSDHPYKSAPPTI